MTLSSWLSIAALIVTSASGFIALLKEKREKRGKRWHRNVLFFLTAGGLIVGVALIMQTSRETNKTEAQHRLDRQSDKEQIAGLNQSIETQIRNNETQYSRNIDEIHRLQEQLTELEKHVATEETRKKMDALRAQLEKALAPAPKAKLEPSFWVSPVQEGVVTEIYAPVDGDVATFDFAIVNHSDIDAKNGSLWIRICGKCEYVDGTDGGLVHLAGAFDNERLHVFGDLPAGARLQKMTVKLRVPTGSTGQKMEVLVKCRCDNCDIEKGWHRLLVTLRGVPFRSPR